MSCTCVAQASGECKHVCALIHFLNSYTGASKTSVEQEWGKPSAREIGKEKYSQPLLITSTFKKKKPKTELIPLYNLQLAKFKSINCPLTDVLKRENVHEAEIAASSVLKSILNQVVKEYDENNVDVCALTLINMSRGSLMNLDDNNLNSLPVHLRKFYETNICVTEEEILNVCKKTVDQSTSSDWFHQRNCRISASSKAHKIKTCPRTGFTELSQKILRADSEKIDAPALKYGMKNEKRAVKCYSNSFDGEIISVGLMIMPDRPFLCASPDGILVSDGCVDAILEVKCPYSCAKKPIYDPDLAKFNVGYLVKEGGISKLRPSHQYYTQCQILMVVSGLNECKLYVWSPVKDGSELVIVQRDEAFIDNLVPKLEEFYFQFYLPAIY